ncbi:hypothetical protein EON66_05290 [archaeon]|nr:MAG: hypothetical protein EON66_05290 [archaeon]
MGDEAVRVVVRCRPSNAKEAAEGRVSTCLDMSPATAALTIRDPSKPGMHHDHDAAQLAICVLSDSFLRTRRAGARRNCHWWRWCCTQGATMQARELLVSCLSLCLPCEHERLTRGLCVYVCVCLIAWGGAEDVKSFSFDAVYDATSTQKVVYEETAFGLVESVLQGYNGTIFAYGQTGACLLRTRAHLRALQGVSTAGTRGKDTRSSPSHQFGLCTRMCGHFAWTRCGSAGSGKTYSMQGRADPPELRGIIPNSFDHIFEFIKATREKVRSQARSHPCSCASC